MYDVFQEQRIAIVEFYFATKSHFRVINAFKLIYSGETAPNASVITYLVHWFRDTGSVVDRKRSVRASIVKTKVADVENTLQRSSMESSRKIAVQLRMSHSSAWRTAS
ncbi:hypothetical protein TNCT_209951 [Trichonephila clavata]|uniref:DUF4817 domain-containing protein n=1 Tax=Trichonephila clavata TaxID=2740835 RepID=A0A8X6LHK2_TRICU|nr:hypothetical protein TNCT_209951 [Trichonephila clavata]